MLEPENEFDSDFASRLSALIRRRRTAKILARADRTVVLPANTIRHDQMVREAVADAGFAPFHFHRNVDALAEPWRFHVLWNDQCRLLGNRIDQWFTDLKPGNKLPAMLAACGALVLVNWIPQWDGEAIGEKRIQINEEHLAATAAAVQTMLLKLTACNLKTYWSSGGLFRSKEFFQRLGIPAHEKLLAAVFVDYGASSDQAECIPGNHVNARSDYRNWTREIQLTDDPA